MKFYKYGKDQESLPCVELDDGTLITEPEILLALIKALVKRGVVTQADIKAILDVQVLASKRLLVGVGTLQKDRIVDWYAEYKL